MKHCKITRDAAYNLQGQMIAKVLPVILPAALQKAGIDLGLVQSYIPAVQQALIPALAAALTQEQYGSQIALFAEENSRLVQNLQGQMTATIRPVAPAPRPEPVHRSAMNPFPVMPQQVPIQHQQPVPANGNGGHGSQPPIPVPQFLPTDQPPSFTDDVVQG